MYLAALLLFLKILLMYSSTVVLEKTLESPLDCKEIKPINPKGNKFWIFIGYSWIFIDWCWSWNSNTLATWCEKLTHLKRPRCWGRLKAAGEGDDRESDGWMASPTWWAWIWASSGSWWWTGKPGVLQSMGSQRVGHDWATELHWSWFIMLLISTLQQSDSVIYINILFHILFHYSLSHSIECSFSRVVTRGLSGCGVWA